MKNLRKVFAVMLALCMVIGTMTITSFAAEGTYDDPHQLSTSSVRFYVYLAPGETQYVQVDDCNGTVVEVGYATTTDFMIQYGRLNTYYPENADGQLSFTMQEGGDMFSVYNSSEEEYVSVYMSLLAGTPADSTGTYDDPKEIILEESFFGISGMEETTLEAGNQGYFYYVEAPSDGLLTVGVNAIDDDYNYIGWSYNVNNTTTGIYGDTHWSDEEEPVYYEELKVSEGDIITVFAATYDPEDMWANPEGTVIVDVTFNPVGSWGCPDTAETGSLDYTFEEDSNGYYTEWTATEEGSVIISASGESGWEFSVNGEMADESYYYGDTYSSNDVEFGSTESLPVYPGDVLTIYVNTARNEETWSCPAGTVTLNIQFISATEEEEVSISDEVIDKLADASTYEGLEDGIVVAIGGAYGENVLTLKELEATTLKDAKYEAIEIDFVNEEFGYSEDLADGTIVDITLAIDEIYAEAETIDVYLLENGELTKLTTCTVAEGNIAFSVSKAGTYVFVDATVVEDTTDDTTNNDTTNDNTTNDNTTNDNTTNDNTSNTTPNTGDASSVAVMLVLAAVAAVVTVVSRKRKEA